MTDKNHSIVSPREDIDINHYIQLAGLSARAKNVILKNCFSLKDLLSLDYENLYAFQNCGRKTAREIMQFIKKLREKRNIHHPLSIKELLAQTPTENSISLLPIFSSKKYSDLTIDDLHQGFHTSVKISELLLSSRTYNVLNTLGLQTVGEVMLTPSNFLLKQYNFGRKSLNEIRRIVRSICLTGEYIPGNHAGKLVAIDYSSYESMVLSFIQQCEGNKRNQQILMEKFCFHKGKAPTLEKLGQHYGISRERVRQIVIRTTAKLRTKGVFDKLAIFWEAIDRSITQGGGLIHLGVLPSIMQAVFNWSSPPYYLALGQLLLLRQPKDPFKKKDDLIQVECKCLSCGLPVQQLQEIDFDSIDSFHIEVLAKKLWRHCQKNCPWNNQVTKFHRAFIERLIEQSNRHLILQDDLVLTHDKWINRYSTSLESITTHILEQHGSPMHFSKIAEAVRANNLPYQNVSDHSIHSALLRYDSIVLIRRGMYGLRLWGGGGYRSVSKAIENLIDNNGLPMRGRDIVQALGEFQQGNIYAALSGWKNRFTSIGDGFYDNTSSWQERNLQQLIQLLPDKVAKFADYLTGKNNTSYKLVMAFIFIRSMDEDGSIYLNNLKQMFYNFYRSRHKKGLVVELDSSVMSRIAEMPPADIKNKACRRPLESFLDSDFFQEYSQNGVRIKLVDHLVAELREGTTRDTLLITILKAIDDYFLKISPAIAPPRASSPPQGAKPHQKMKPDKPESGREQHPSSITIKKKRRRKINL